MSKPKKSRDKDEVLGVYGWPAGTQLREKTTGQVAILGTSARHGNFWVMNPAAGEKFVLSASNISAKYEVAEDAR